MKDIVLDVPDWPDHEAGQHVDIRLTAPDGYRAQRSYSIASAPGNGTVTLTVERLPDGEVSPYLVDELRSGDLIEVRGPIGGYFVWKPDLGGPMLLVAGGSGVVPLMSMLRHRASTATAVEARLLYSSRSLADVIYRSELDRRSDEESKVEVIYTLTRSQPPGWTGYARRIDIGLLREVAWAPNADPLAYICGPTSFVEAAASGLVELGYDPTRVRTERFGPTGGSE